MRRALPVVLILAAACSLPVPGGVHTGNVGTGAGNTGTNIDAFPPDPKAGQSPGEVVQGFIRAQANSSGRHAIARKYLTDRYRTSWSDGGQIDAYDPDSLEVTQPNPPGLSAEVTVTARLVGQVGTDDGYVPTTRSIEETYRVTRATTKADWRIQQAPAGLRLTLPDLQRDLLSVDVYYLAPRVSDGDSGHLVPDAVYLAPGNDLARSLVNRMLRPPSSALALAVGDGLPSGATFRADKVSTSTDGIVTVDLAGPVSVLTAQQRQDLSARLIWTLKQIPGFNALHLESGGKTLPVPGTGALQDKDSYAGYDPEGLGFDVPYYYVDDRRLRSSAVLKSTTMTDPRNEVLVDEVAVLPNRTEVAVLEHHKDGFVQVYLGPLAGPSYPVIPGLREVGLSSPTWGSGGFNLWMIQSGTRIVRVGENDTSIVDVPFADRPPGTITSLAMSRDGVQAALVIDHRVYVAQVQVTDAGPVLTHPVLLPTLVRVTQVAWATATDLEVVASATDLEVAQGQAAPHVLRVSEDDSVVQALRTGSLVPTHVAAAQDQLLLESHGRLYSSSNLLVPVASGTGPVFPG